MYDIVLKTSKIILLSIFFTSVGYADVSTWGHDYNKALQKAQKEHKLVYMFIGADKCKYCDRFKKMTLSKDKIIEEMKKDYILLYLSGDQHKIPDKFDIVGVPKHYFLTHKGEVVYEDHGIQEPEGWSTILDSVDLNKEDFNLSDEK